MRALNNLKITFSHYYKNQAIPPEILEERPLVLDPSNPFNNITSGLSRLQQSDFELIENAAILAMTRLQDMQHGSSPIILSELFSIFPEHPPISLLAKNNWIFHDEKREANFFTTSCDRTQMHNLEAKRVAEHYLA